jgi:hypothetical protein
MTARVAWAKGGEATVVALVEDAITLRSSIPSPPGSRIDGTLGSGEAVRVKVHSSKKQSDGSFVLEGRVLDMTRAVRATLEGMGEPPAEDRD